MANSGSEKEGPEELAAKLKAARAKRAMQGERRIITMLFCDVTGSTAMASQLDPEEWAEIMNEAFDFLINPIYRYQGTVARLMGDAILAFFGAPVAHEDDPQRAVLAGLEIISDIEPFRLQLKADYGLDFNVRVGINTGPVVVGEVGSELALEYTAMGDAVNLAARMEQTAQPGTVQISEQTHRLVGPLFEVEALGQIQVKGKAQPVSAYRVLRPKIRPGRTRGIEGLGERLVGREQEMEALRRILQELRQGRGGIVCLIGEAGLGKSRLIEELQAASKAEEVELNWVESRCRSYDEGQPYSLFRQHLKQGFGVEDHDSPAVIRDKITQHLATYPEESREDLKRLLEVLLSIETESDTPTPEGEALKRKLFATMLLGWRDSAQSRPLVVVFDDLHWADPASIELLLHIFQLVEEVPILYLCALRPERQSPGWLVKLTAETVYLKYYTQLDLSRLSDADTEKLVDNLLAISDLPAELRRLILHKTEGNPFFVEEVLRSLIDSGAVVRNETGLRWRSAISLEAIAIPDNVQALLVSRIDRLRAETRRTLQLAAVIGRTFYHRVLQAVSTGADSLDRTDRYPV